jgi:hypothetical protein
VKSKDAQIVTNALFPTLWRRTPRGIAGLTSNGLASLLPHYPSQPEDAPSCLGRKWLIERLLESAANTGCELPTDLPTLERKTSLRATERDLQGV